MIIIVLVMMQFYDIIKRKGWILMATNNWKVVQKEKGKYIVENSKINITPKKAKEIKPEHVFEKLGKPAEILKCK